MINSSTKTPITQNPCYTQPFSEVNSEECTIIKKKPATVDLKTCTVKELAPYPLFATTRKLSVLWYRYDDGSGAKPVRAYLDGDPLAESDLALMTNNAADCKRWSLEPIPFLLPPFKTPNT